MRTVPGRKPEEERCTRGIDGVAEPAELERGVKPDRLEAGAATRGMDVREPGAPDARGAVEPRTDPLGRVIRVGVDEPGTLGRRKPDEFGVFEGRLARGAETLGDVIRLGRELAPAEPEEPREVRGVKPDDLGALLGAWAEGALEVGRV